MLQLEVLVCELVAVDGFPASTIAIREVAALNHELLDDTVECGAFVAKALLAGCQCSMFLLVRSLDSRRVGVDT